MKRRTIPTVIEILRFAKIPLRIPEIVEMAGENLPCKSKTPCNSVARDIALEVRDNPDTKIKRVGFGLYALKEGESNGEM